MSENREELIGGRYALVELLGVGGTGSVFAATDLQAGGGERRASSDLQARDERGAAGDLQASGEGPAPTDLQSGGGERPAPIDLPSGVGERRAARAAGSADGGRGDVAVKLLHPHLCDDEASRTAFLREAEHVIGLEHPNIVRVHAAGLHDAGGVIMPWIALDLLQGPTLREWVDAVGRLSTPDAAAIADGLLSGLGAAHAAGIVHRDISPQNVILHGAGDPGVALTADMVRIVDFGLADLAGRSTLGGDVLLAAAPAEGDGVVGNAAFMSPEQAQGRPVRAVSDLYQAGAVLYFTLTGRAPFPRPTTEQVLQAHLSAPPPVPSALAPAARAFDRLVTKSMAKTPAHRFRDAAEFRAAVLAAAGAAAATAATPTPVEPDAASDAASDAGPVDADPESGDRTSATRLLPSGPAAPLGYLSPALEPAPATAPARGNAGFAAGAIGVVILALAGWAVVAAAASPSLPTAEVSSTAAPPSAAPEPTPTAAASTPPPASEAPPPPAEEVVDAAVPALHGTLADAETALRTAGLALGQVTRVESAESADRVLGQTPGAGEAVAPGTAVSVTVASGNNVVPQVSNMTFAAAIAQLESAGFIAGGERPASPTSMTVAGTQPSAGTVLRVGTTVTLVAVPAPTPTPRPTTTETPGGTP